MHKINNKISYKAVEQEKKINAKKKGIKAMKKKILMTMAALAVGITASADEFSYLSFETTSGKVVSVGVEKLEMEFADGKLKVTAADGTKEFSVADLSRMYFSSEATAIKELTTAGSGTAKTVYSLSGTKLGVFESLAGIKATLGSGLYIIKDNNNTTKIMVK